MKLNQGRRLLAHVLNDYGMILVLLVLMLIFSIVTIDRQEATGESAGMEIANRIKQNGDSNSVVLITGKTNLDLEIAKGLESGLKDTEYTIIDTIQGNPVDANRALKKIKLDGHAIDFIACTSQTAKWDPVKDSGYALITPEVYYWPDFLMPDNLVAIAQRITIIAIIAIGMTMIIISGGIDLSVGSIIALAAVVTGIVIGEYGGSDAGALVMLCGAVCGMLAGAICGFGTGFLVAAFRLPPFIVTLAMMLIVRGIANVLSEQRTIHAIPATFESLGKGNLYGLPVSVWLMVGLYFLAHLVMSRTVLGRQVYAVGGNEEAARLSGVRVKRVQLTVYTVCGLLAGLGGVIMTSQLRSAKADYGQMYELAVIAAVVVGGASLMGGQGKVLGTLIGAFIIGTIQNAMNIVKMDDKTQMIVLGSVIILSVLLDRIKKRQVSWSDITGIFAR